MQWCAGLVGAGLGKGIVVASTPPIPRKGRVQMMIAQPFQSNRPEGAPTAGRRCGKKKQENNLELFWTAGFRLVLMLLFKRGPASVFPFVAAAGDFLPQKNILIIFSGQATHLPTLIL